MPTAIQSQLPVTQKPSNCVVPNPYVEQYIQAELSSVGHFRKIGACVLLHDLALDGIGPADKLALKQALTKHADTIDPDAKAMFETALKTNGRLTETQLKFDAKLVHEYAGYVTADGKVTGDEADYLLTTARNIGGSKAVKAELATQLRLHADAFEPAAKEKLKAFIAG